MTCIHLGPQTKSTQIIDGRQLPVFTCRHPSHRTTTLEACAACMDNTTPDPVGERRQAINARALRRKARIERRVAARQAAALANGDARTVAMEMDSVPPPVGEGPFVDAHGRSLPLDNLFRGASCFIILSGPSIRSLDLSVLRDRRGIVTFGVNNSPAIFRPTLWTYVDRASKFLDSIWTDPGIIKIPPDRHLRKTLRRKVRPADGGAATFETIMRQSAGGRNLAPAEVRDMPAVIAHRRNAYFAPDRWLAEPTINWGNSKRSAKKNGGPRCLNVMLCTIKMAYALGFRTVYLLGCDFSMDAEQPYAFAQHKSSGGVSSNNTAYRVLNEMFGQLKPHFDAAGYRVFNCNPRSGMRVFDFVRFEDAVAAATAGVGQDPLDTADWYETKG